MVIDFHTHAFPDAIAERAISSLVKGCGGEYQPIANGTLSGLLSAMDNFGVDISVLQPVVTKPSQTESLNLWAKNAQSERIIAFGGIHPQSDSLERDIDYVCSLGLRGIKLHPEYQCFDILDPRMMRAYEYALDKGLVLLFHAGYDPAFKDCHTSPKKFAELSKAMKGGTVVAAHLGGQRQWDDVQRYLCGSDIYIDSSMGFDYYGAECFLRVLNAHGAQRILFGSDSPWSNAKRDIEALTALPIKDSEKELVLCGNAKRILGI